MKLKIVNKILITIGSILIGCFNLKCKDNGVKQNINSSYRVYKIDSINNFYLIYAHKERIKYKIVSKKRFCEPKDKILIDGYYEFDLSSMIYDSKELPIHPGGGGSIRVDSITTIFLEDSINDIFSAKNIEGLCFVKSN